MFFPSSSSLIKNIPENPSHISEKEISIENVNDTPDGEEIEVEKVEDELKKINSYFLPIPKSQEICLDFSSSLSSTTSSSIALKPCNVTNKNQWFHLGNCNKDLRKFNYKKFKKNFLIKFINKNIFNNKLKMINEKKKDDEKTKENQEVEENLIQNFEKDNNFNINLSDDNLLSFEILLKKHNHLLYHLLSFKVDAFPSLSSTDHKNNFIKLFKLSTLFSSHCDSFHFFLDDYKDYFEGYDAQDGEEDSDELKCNLFLGKEEDRLSSCLDVAGMLNYFINSIIIKF